MKHRDYVRRIVKYAGGEKLWIFVEREICPACNHVERVLPFYILPFKHYDKRIIWAVQHKRIDENTYGFEDYPCEMTMNRWRKIKTLERME